MSANFPVPCDDTLMHQLAWSAFHAPALAIADELGMFEAIYETPSSADDLADRLKIDPRATEAILGLMASLGFVAQIDRRFHLTDVARHLLLPQSPYYWGGFLKRLRDTPIDCHKYIEAVRANAPSSALHANALWETTKPSPERLREFTNAMHARSFSLAMRAVPAGFELENTARLLDVAGGSGSYSIAAAHHFPELRCSVMDLGPVTEVSRELIDKAGLSRRIDVVPRDMFNEAWPTGYDYVFFSDILHDWDDERCRFLARRSFEALQPGGRILVHEMPLGDAKDGPTCAMAFSTAVVWATRGRQRSGRELITLLESAGFHNVRVKPTCSGYALFQGTKRV